MKRLVPVVCALLCLSAAALAAGPKGIAFVHAPEMGSGVCTGNTPEKAFACAREQCIREGGNTQACKRIAWCFPARWSVDVFLQNTDGYHWHEVTCGLDSRETAAKVAEAQCDRKTRPYLRECTVTRFFDPDGKPLDPR
ncbi:MAG: hypothetical protein EBS39_05710 [Gammaproteobacteria bacterium]|nr:hypothetical protein [Gammaproteobacteria bacterium]